MVYAQSRSGYPSTSATGRVSDNLALYGHTRTFDEPEDRPIPAEEDLSGVVASLFSDISGPFSDTGLEPELEDILWSFVDVFHRKIDRMQKRLDDNEMRIRTAQESNDGSEIASVELERLVAMGENLIARPTPSSTCGTVRSRSSRTLPVPPGARARPRWSITRRPPRP